MDLHLILTNQFVLLIVSTYLIPNYIEDFNFSLMLKELHQYSIISFTDYNERLIRIGNIGDITTNELYDSLFIMKPDKSTKIRLQIKLKF